MTTDPSVAHLMRALTERLAADRVLTDEPLAGHTFYRIGGPADFFVVVESAEE